MLAAVCARISPDDPLAGLEVRDMPEPVAADGWEVDRGSRGGAEPARHLEPPRRRRDRGALPIALGTDAAGVTADGREVVVHAVLGSAAAG